MKKHGSSTVHVLEINRHLESALSCEDKSFSPLALRRVSPDAILGEYLNGGGDTDEFQLGATKTQLPAIFMSLGSHPNYAGSAFFSMGETKVSVAVESPAANLASSSGQAKIEVSILTGSSPNRGLGAPSTGKDVAAFLSNRMAGISGHYNDVEYEVPKQYEWPLTTGSVWSEVQELNGDFDELVGGSLCESIVESLNSVVVLSKYENCVLKIKVFILVDGGLLLPCILNCCCLALADGGIQLSDMFGSSSAFCFSLPTTTTGVDVSSLTGGVSSPSPGGTACMMHYALDPNKIPKSCSVITEVTASFLSNPKSDSLIYLHGRGDYWVPPYLTELLRMARLASDFIVDQMKECLKDNVDTA